MSAFAVTFRLADGMVRIRAGRYGEQPWTRRAARKATICEATGTAIKVGDQVYAPVGNPMNRSQRVLAAWVEGGRGKKSRIRWGRPHSEGFVESHDGRWQMVPLCMGTTRAQSYTLRDRTTGKERWVERHREGKELAQGIVDEEAPARSDAAPVRS